MKGMLKTSSSYRKVRFLVWW